MITLTRLQHLAAIFGWKPTTPNTQTRAYSAIAPGMALSAMKNALNQSSVPNEQHSEDATFDSILGRFESHFAGYPDDQANRIIKIFRWLAQRDEDVFGSITDMRALANAGHTVEFIGGTRAVAQAQAEVEAWSESIYPEGAGVDGLVNNQMREPFISGASSLEWVPAKNRKTIQAVLIVPAETISTIVRDPDTLQWRYFQRRRVGTEQELHPITFNYIPTMNDSSNPYGIPLLISSLAALDRKGRLLEFEERVIEAMKQIALITAAVPAPTPESLGCNGETDPNYQQLLTEYYRRVADLISAGSKKGLYLGPQGTEFKLTNIAKSADGINDIRAANDRRVWTAIRTLPFMRGMMDSTTEALAQVVYPILEAEAGNLQLITARALEFGYNLQLRLRGIPARARVQFHQPDSPFALNKAKTDRERMETDKTGFDVFGNDWAPHAASRWDVKLGIDRQQVPDSFERASTPTSTPPAAPQGRTHSLETILSNGVSIKRLVFSRRGGKAGSYERD